MGGEVGGEVGGRVDADVYIFAFFDEGLDNTGTVGENSAMQDREAIFIGTVDVGTGLDEGAHIFRLVAYGGIPY